MIIFDTHAHTLDERLTPYRTEILSNLAGSLLGFMECATSMEDIGRVAAFSNEHERIFCALGVHPQEAAAYDGNRLKELILKTPRAVALGEIGLDYYYEKAPRERQKQVFDAQLSLAEELNLPVVIHMRDATSDTFEILTGHHARGVFHCFSGSAETAKRALSMGFFISFSGTVTYKNAVKVADAAAVVPLNRLMAETDCPYLAPQPVRGQVNRPENVKYTIEKLAEIKGVSAEEMAGISLENYRALFGANI